MGIAALRYGVHLPVFTDPGSLVDLGVLAEQRGWDGCFLWDHIVGSRQPPMPIADPWVTLGALAVRTERIRLGTAVTAGATWYLLAGLDDLGRQLPAGPPG